MPVKKTTRKTPAKKSATKKAVAKKTTRKEVKKPVKKTAKKASAKKTTKKVVSKKSVKRTTQKNSAKRSMVTAENDKSFWTTNGQVLNSLVALRDALDEMEKEVYLYHAGGKHNDFANWVDKVLSDAKCAKALKKAKTPNSAKTVISRHLKLYSF